MRDGEQPVPVHSIGEMVALLGPAAENLPTHEDTDPWTAIGEELGIEELLPARAGAGADEENELGQEAGAHTDGSL
ncbi:hypothetical protein ACFV6F_28475 [Kitasatospora phosalacinea]|uniref:hypothetical protein n=1 Tax=Kitasatospora phosalacinea TaxID=2065 RepID=UPI0036513C63